MTLKETALMPQVEVHFVVWGKFDPDEVTQQLSLTPTRTRRRGDALGVSKAQAREDTWRLVFGPTNTMDGTAQIKALVDSIEPRTSTLTVLRDAGATTRITFVAYVARHRGSAIPNISLDHELLERLTALGVELVFDIMLLESDTDEPS
jgi:hypothetical protein